MKINVQKAEPKSIKADALAFFQFEDNVNTNEIVSHFGKSSSLFNAARALVDSGDTKGKKDEIFVLYPGSDTKAKRVFIAGLGKKEKLGLEQVRRSLARIAKKAVQTKSKSLAFFLPEVAGSNGAQIAAAAVEGVKLGLYKFDKFFKKEEEPFVIESVTILHSDGSLHNSSIADVKKAVEQAEIVSDATIFARDMENEPSNNKYPEVLAGWAQAMGKECGVKVTSYGPSELKKNNMIGTLTVNKGSEREARFIVMEYYGAKSKTEAPYIFVGKGITFDTGGISLKPAAGMGEMKSDMSGAATVIASLRAAAQLKLPVNLIGLVASAENMPSGTAMRPGDIITYPNGVSAEIDNTDAEGRLVLADALIWAEKFKPKSVIDLATLTGACVVALGHVTTGMMGNDDDMMDRLRKAGLATHERVCELPIYEEYEELIKSDVADIKNVGGRWAGSITAALFLKRFTNYPWVHLDIAGTARSESNGDYIPKGGTGVGVRLLTEMLRNGSMN